MPAERPLAYGALGAVSNAFVDKNGVHVTDGSVERVRVGRLTGSEGLDATPTYGLQVWGPGGSAIIDGTSDVFKIVASGTVSNTIGAAAGSVVSNWTDTTITGPFSATPAHLSFIATATGNGAPRTIGRLFTYTQLFAAGASGGSPTVMFIAPSTVMDVSTLLSGSDAVVRFGGYNAQGSSQTWHCRYYVLKEAAL